MTHADPLTETLANARVILFDFDGPLCDVFAGLPASEVADELTALLSAQDAAAGTKAAGTDDPLDVLRIAHEADTELGQKVERALTAAEVRPSGHVLTHLFPTALLGSSRWRSRPNICAALERSGTLRSTY